MVATANSLRILVTPKTWTLNAATFKVLALIWRSNNVIKKRAIWCRIAYSLIEVNPEINATYWKQRSSKSKGHIGHKKALTITYFARNIYLKFLVHVTLCKRNWNSNLRSSWTSHQTFKPIEDLYCRTWTANMLTNWQLNGI